MGLFMDAGAFISDARSVLATGGAATILTIFLFPLLLAGLVLSNEDLLFLTSIVRLYIEYSFLVIVRFRPTCGLIIKPCQMLGWESHCGKLVVEV